MKSNSELARENKWSEQSDEAQPDDKYRVELVISQLTKREAIILRANLMTLLQKVIPEHKFFIDNDLLECTILNEDTGRYTQTLEDKY